MSASSPVYHGPEHCQPALHLTRMQQRPNAAAYLGLDTIAELLISHNKSVIEIKKRKKGTFAISRQLLSTLMPKFCHRRCPLPPPPLVSTLRRNIHRLYLCPATIHDVRLNQLRQLPSSGPKISMGEGNANNLALSWANGPPALLPLSSPVLLSIQGRVSGRFSVAFPSSGSSYPIT